MLKSSGELLDFATRQRRRIIVSFARQRQLKIGTNRDTTRSIYVCQDAIELVQRAVFKNQPSFAFCIVFDQHLSTEFFRQLILQGKNVRVYWRTTRLRFLSFLQSSDQGFGLSD